MMNNTGQAYTDAMRVQLVTGRGVHVAVLSTDGEYSHVIELAGGRCYRIRTARLANVPDQRPLGGARLSHKRYITLTDYAAKAKMAEVDDEV